jgi:hypothetical protein
MFLLSSRPFTALLDYKALTSPAGLTTEHTHTHTSQLRPDVVGRRECGTQDVLEIVKCERYQTKHRYCTITTSSSLFSL